VKLEKSKLNKSYDVNDQYAVTSFICFINPSTISKHSLSEIFKCLLNDGNFEVLGCKMVKAKKELF
jgi:hypothetical protein